MKKSFLIALGLIPFIFGTAIEICVHTFPNKTFPFFLTGVAFLLLLAYICRKVKQSGQICWKHLGVVHIIPAFSLFLLLFQQLVLC